MTTRNQQHGHEHYPYCIHHDTKNMVLHSLYIYIYSKFRDVSRNFRQFLSKTCCSKFIRPVLKHGPRSATCMRVLGWKTHLHNESEDVSLLSQEPARKHIVVMYAMQFFMVHLLAIIWFHIKMIHHHPHSSTRQKLPQTRVLCFSDEIVRGMVICLCY